jgi:putative two-component system response regulator
METVGEQTAGCVSESGSEAVLLALAEAVEQRNPHIAGHCQRLAFVSVTVGMAMGLDRSSLLALYRGGYLHDVGKVGIPDSILFKPSSLTEEEWDIMRSHSSRGEEICRHLQSMEPVLPIIRHHHERWDGSGYPDGLRGERIPLLARVLQIADIYDALTSPRPYKPAFDSKDALRTIEQETARGWRDPEIVKVFLAVHENVIARLPGNDRDLEVLRAYVGRAGLQQTSGRSSHRLRPGPADGFPSEEADRSRTA